MNMSLWECVISCTVVTTINVSYYLSSFHNGGHGSPSKISVYFIYAAVKEQIIKRVILSTEVWMWHRLKEGIYNSVAIICCSSPALQK